MPIHNHCVKFWWTRQFLKQFDQVSLRIPSTDIWVEWQSPPTPIPPQPPQPPPPNQKRKKNPRDSVTHRHTQADTGKDIIWRPLLKRLPCLAAYFTEHRCAIIQQNNPTGGLSGFTVHGDARNYTTLLYTVTGPLWGDSTGHQLDSQKRHVMLAFDKAFVVMLNKQLNKQLCYGWIQVPWS